MRYAVDRYILGYEQEVKAESVSFPIPQRRSRFFCPECGEPVFFRAKGSGEFYHQKQIEGVTPECDKRVDGRSRLSLYERIGLSLCIVLDAGSGIVWEYPSLRWAERHWILRCGRGHGFGLRRMNRNASSE